MPLHACVAKDPDETCYACGAMPWERLSDRTDLWGSGFRQPVLRLEEQHWGAQDSTLRGGPVSGPLPTACAASWLRLLQAALSFEK